ncbi:MAG TPA: DUF167 family protein [Xanthobacteraceae bacterium]
MRAAFEPPWRRLADGLAVSVRATPKGGRDAIDGVAQLGNGHALKIRVRAAPAEGEANRAVARVLAGAAGVPPSSVELLQGAAGRLKTFRISGDPARLAAALEHAIAGRETKRK